MADEEVQVPGEAVEEPSAVGVHAEAADVLASGEPFVVEAPSTTVDPASEAPPGIDDVPVTENVPEAQERVKRKFENVETTEPDAVDGQQAVNDEPQAAAAFDAEAAKQKAADLAAKFALEGESKRPRTDEAYDGNGDYGVPSAEPVASTRISGFSDGPPAYNDEAPPGAGGENYSHVPAMSQQQSYYQSGGDGSTTKRMEVPNAKVGLVIGKAGETIKYLQQQSGARIQVTRDAEIDPSNPTRPVELVGTPEQIDRAEKLITEVISEQAGTGGSGALVARGFGGPAPETVTIQVPNNKVGLIIGRGGETIKNLQMRSGARIQVQSDRETDSTLAERTVTLIGNKRATDVAKDMILDVIDENRPRGPPSYGGGGGYGGGRGGGYGPPQQGYGGGYQAPYAAPPHQYGGQVGQYGDYQQQAQYGAPAAGPPSGYDYYGQQQAPPAAAAPAAAAGADPSYAYGQQSQGYYGGYQQPAPGAAGGYQQQGYQQQAYGAHPGYGAQAAAPAYGGYGAADQTYQQQGYGQQQYAGGYQQTGAEGGAAAGGYDYSAGPTTTSSAPPAS